MQKNGNLTVLVSIHKWTVISHYFAFHLDILKNWRDLENDSESNLISLNSKLVMVTWFLILVMQTYTLPSWFPVIFGNFIFNLVNILRFSNFSLVLVLTIRKRILESFLLLVSHFLFRTLSLVKFPANSHLLSISANHWATQ